MYENMYEFMVDIDVSLIWLSLRVVCDYAAEIPGIVWFPSSVGHTV